MPAQPIHRILTLSMIVLLGLWPLARRAGLSMVSLTPTPWVLYLEAEQCELAEPALRVSDVLASDCAYVEIQERDRGSITLTFSVPSDGNYYPWARVMGLDLLSNSFYFSIDGGAPGKYEFHPFHGLWTWGWDRVHIEKECRTTPLVLTAGTHTLTFSGREPGARLDAIIITDDPEYMPLGIQACPLAPSATPTSTPGATPTPDPHATATPFVWQMEAERGALAAPMTLAEDVLASACGYVYTLERDSGSVTFTFVVPSAGNYYPWVRAMGLSLSENSFFFSVDGSPRIWYEIPPYYCEWTWIWDRVHASGEPDETPLVLSAGAHTVVLGGREPESRLDAFLITNDLAYDPVYQAGSSVPCATTPNVTSTSSPTPIPPTATMTLTPTHSATPSPSPTGTPLPEATLASPTATPSRTPSLTHTFTPGTPTPSPTLGATLRPKLLHLPLVLR